MGVLEFQQEMEHLRASFESGLIHSEDQYEKMCIDNQRRNLSTLACPSTDATSIPLNRLALQRLLFPVCVTLSVLAVVLLAMVGILYEALSYEIINARNETSSMQATAEYGAQLEINNKKHIIQTVTKLFSNRPLLYLSTNEGLLSHLLQLQQLWSLTHMLNRTLAPVSFHSSSHFPEVEWIHLCDIFELPSDITCNCGTLPDGFVSHHQSNKDKSNVDKDNQQSQLWYGCTPPYITKNFKCTLMGSYAWAIDPRMYSLPHGHPVSHTFDFETGECIAGHVDPKSGFFLTNSSAVTNAGISNSLVNIVNGGAGGPQQQHVFAVKFAEKYSQLIRKARQRLTALAIDRSNTKSNSNSDSSANSSSDSSSEMEEKDKDRRLLSSSSDSNSNSSNDTDGLTDSPTTTSSSSSSSSDSKSSSAGSSSDSGTGHTKPFTTVHWISEEYRSKSLDCSNGGGQGQGLGQGGGGGSASVSITNGNSNGDSNNRTSRSRSHRNRRRLNVEKDKEAFSRGRGGGGGGGCITHTEFIEMIKAQGLGRKRGGASTSDHNNNNNNNNNKKDEEDEKSVEIEEIDSNTIDDEDEQEELIYVVTNEKNTTILSDFTANGLVLFSDLHMDDLTSLEISVVELGDHPCC